MCSFCKWNLFSRLLSGGWTLEVAFSQRHSLTLAAGIEMSLGWHNVRSSGRSAQLSPCFQLSCGLFLECLLRIPSVLLRAAVERYKFSWSVWPLKMEPKGCPETSVTNCWSTLRNITEELISRFLRGKGLESRDFHVLSLPIQIFWLPTRNVYFCMQTLTAPRVQNYGFCFWRISV